MPPATGEKESGAFVPPQKLLKAYPQPVTCVPAGQTATEGASEGKQAAFPQMTWVSVVLFDFQRPDWHVCPSANPVAGLEVEKLAIKDAPGMYLRIPIVGLMAVMGVFTSKQLSVRKIMWPPGQECLALHRVLMTNTSIFIAAHLVECQIRSLGDFVN